MRWIACIYDEAISAAEIFHDSNSGVSRAPTGSNLRIKPRQVHGSWDLLSAGGQ